MTDKPAPMVLLLKTHVVAYVKKDGTAVATHEDSRPAKRHPELARRDNLPEWEDRGKKGNLQEWRIPLPNPRGRRKFLRVVENVATGFVTAETSSGYMRRCKTVTEAKQYLEADIQQGSKVQMPSMLRPPKDIDPA